jgi:YfiH family protein
LTVQAGRWVLLWSAPAPLRVDGVVAARVLGAFPGPGASAVEPAGMESAPGRATGVGCATGPAAGAVPAEAEVARLGQVHGERVVVVDRPGFVPDCDAAVTAVPGLFLSVRVADCVPVLVAGSRAIGVAHAGWRGTAAGIAGCMAARVAALSEEGPAGLAAFIGPSIGPCCYDVGEVVARRFDPSTVRADRTGLHLDLWRANREQLLAAGLPPDRIIDSALCTRCHQHLFHSHRGSGGRPGRLEVFLVRRPETLPDHPDRLRS